MACTSVLSYTTVFLICIISTVLADYCDSHCLLECCFYNYCCDDSYCCGSGSSYHSSTTSTGEFWGIVIGVIVGGLVCIAIVFVLCLRCPFCTLYKRRHNKGKVFNQITQQPPTVAVCPPNEQQVWQQQQQQPPPYPVQQYYITQPVQAGITTTPGPHEQLPPYTAAPSPGHNT